MRIAFFSEGINDPASRFRCQQFIPRFERAGHECSMFYGYNSLYNLLHATPLAPLYKIAFRGRRAWHTLTARGYDILFFQRTSFPFWGYPEQLRQTLGARTVFDFDDSLHVGAGGRPSTLRAQAFRSVIRGATHIVAGNDYLAQVAGHPDKTTTIPTAVDTDRYWPLPQRSHTQPITLGWMGTSSNFASLRAVLPSILTVLQRRPDVRLRVVSNALFPELRGVDRVEQIMWGRGREVELLQSFDIGLMPLEDNEATRGKCGFKMLQYMATGAAVAVSAVGANREIFEGSGAGAMIPAGGDWTAPLLDLLSDTKRRRECSMSGRRHVEARYSARIVASRYLELFERLFDSQRSPHAHLT